MDETTQVEVVATTESTRDRFIKMIAGVAVGFIATSVTENLVDGILAKRRAK